MKTKKKLLFAIIVGAVIFVSAAYAGLVDSKKPVEFFKSHTHEGNETTGAPEHSGGLDRNGCHNKSVPYHCR